MRWWQRQSLRLKLALGINLTMLLVLGGSFYGIARYVRAQLWQREVQAAENLNAVAATMLEDAMMVGRKDRIQEALEQLGDSVGGQIDSVAVYDDQAVLTEFATGFPGGRAIQRESLAVGVDEPTCWECHQLPAQERPPMIIISLEGQDVIRNVVPLRNEPRCQTCHGVGQAVLGDSIVDLRLDRYNQALQSVLLGLGGGILLSLVLVALVLYLIVRRTVLRPVGDLLDVTEAVTGGDLTREVAVRGSDEMGQVGRAFNAMTRRLRALVGGLEQRVADRTRELERRSSYLAASAEVSRYASTILNRDELVRNVAILIQERFGLYYAGLFLLDARREWAILRAGTGEAGKAMLARGHRLRVGEGSMVGWCIQHNQARVAQQAELDSERASMSELPDTRSEAALPLRSRGQVLGALTVQSDQTGVFDRDTMATLQVMADQVATALDNAALYAASQTALETERRAYGEASRQSWKNLLQAESEMGYRYDRGETRQVGGDWVPEMVQAADLVQIVEDSAESGVTMAVPLVVRGQVVGVMHLGKTGQDAVWTEEDRGYLAAIAEQLAIALDGARLYGETQSSAARERTIAEATTQMREPLELDDVLQTAVREIRSALDLDELVLKMVPSEEQAD